MQRRSDGESVPISIGFVELRDGFPGERLEKGSLGVGNPVKPLVVEFGVDSDEGFDCSRDVRRQDFGMIFVR